MSNSNEAIRGYTLLDYSIQDGKKHPVAIICPGGGYWFVSIDNEGEPFAKKLNTMGISAFVVSYRVAKEARFPNPQDDLAKAVQEVMNMSKEKNLDMSNYSIWGSSAGGHLAATFGTKQVGYEKYGLPKPDTLVLVYPVVTMGEFTHTDSRYNLLGKQPSDEMKELLSVEKQITSDYPATFLWCGDTDTCVVPQNSHSMVAALEAAGVTHKFIEYAGVGHGVGLNIGGAAESWFEEAVKFWLNRS